MAKRKRLEAWANEYVNGLDLYERSDDARRYAKFYTGATRERVRLVECDESETVIGKAELRALRAVAKAAQEWAKGSVAGEVPPWTNTTSVRKAVERLKKGTNR